MKKTKLAPKFWVALIIFSLVGQVAWVVENMYFNVFIYKMFRASAADISMMVAASAVIATLTTIFIGALSDKLGKRKFFICGGYIIWGITIVSFAFIRTDIISSIFSVTASAASIGITLVIIMDCVMTFFGSTANDACFNAWLTDSTDSTNRGGAEGINAMMPLVAILVVFGGFMGFNLDLPESWTTIFLIIGISVSVIGVLGIFIVREPQIDKSGNSRYFANIIYGFRPSVMKDNKNLYLSLLAFAVFNISIQIFMPYLILYYEVSLGMENYVLIMAPAIIVAALVTLFYGKLYDRVHFKVAVLPALGMLALGYIVLFIFRSTVPVFIGSLLMMSGYLAGMAVFGAMIRDNTPENRAGMFQGLRIVCQVLIPGIIGPAIGAAVLKNAEVIVNSDGTTSFIPNANIFIAALIAEVCVAPLLIVIFRFLRKGEKREA
ncbi:MAG: MFS transporter [Lachnospiraceae bacterium]|nr:MFS transporter [Lachnospiraceae bacterium]